MAKEVAALTFGAPVNGEGDGKVCFTIKNFAIQGEKPDFDFF